MFHGFSLAIHLSVVVCIRDVCTNILAIYYKYVCSYITREYYAGDVICVTCEPTFSCEGTLIFFWPIASPSSKLERAKRLIPHPQTIQHFCFPPVWWDKLFWRSFFYWLARFWCRQTGRSTRGPTLRGALFLSERRAVIIFFGGTHCTKISNDFWSLDPDSVSVPGFRGKRICEKGLQKWFIRRKFSGQRCIDPDPVLKESWIRIRFVLRGRIRVRLIQTGSETLDKMRYLKIICICVPKKRRFYNSVSKLLYRLLLSGCRNVTLSSGEVEALRKLLVRTCLSR